MKHQAMTEKEKRYKAELRNIGKHLHKNEYMPINLAKNPMQFSDNRHKYVMVNWGWAARTADGSVFIDFDDVGNPKPFEGFWEARYYSC